VILCDCDVECPNDYLLLEKKLVKPKAQVFAEYPQLDKKKCDKCASLNKNNKKRFFNRVFALKPVETMLFFKLRVNIRFF